MRRIGQSECTHCVRLILYALAGSVTTYRTPRKTGWVHTSRARTATVDWPNQLNLKIDGYASICNKWMATVALSGSVADSIGASITGSGATTET